MLGQTNAPAAAQADKRNMFFLCSLRERARAFGPCSLKSLLRPRSPLPVKYNKRRLWIIRPGSSICGSVLEQYLHQERARGSKKKKLTNKPQTTSLRCCVGLLTPISFARRIWKGLWKRMCKKCALRCTSHHRRQQQARRKH